MLKGIYTFPDKSVRVVQYHPEKSDKQAVYVEWRSTLGLTTTAWLPTNGLKLPKGKC
jgi:hypothetical protein